MSASQGPRRRCGACSAIRPRSRSQIGFSLIGTPLSSLALDALLRVFPFAADLEGTEVLEPLPVRRLRFRFSPELQLIEILDGDLAISKSIKQVVAESWRQIHTLDLRHYSPKVIRASSSLRSFCSEGCDERASRSASSKNSLFSRSRASRPVSMRSTITRLSLVRWRFAKAWTRLATSVGRLTLWRTAVFCATTGGSYTTLHRYEPHADRASNVG